MSKKTIEALAAELQTAEQPKESTTPEQPAEPTEQELAPVITLEELEAMALPGDTTEAEEAARPPFRIADDGCADWAVRKIAVEKAEYDRIRTLGEEQIARIQQQIDAAKRRFEQNTAFLTSHLGQYFQTVPHRCTKTTEKYRLLSGTLTLKYGAADTKRDDTKLVAFLRRIGRDDLVNVKEEAAWGDLKKLLTFAGDTAIIAETGEIVEGVTVTTKPDTFTVDV